MSRYPDFVSPKSSPVCFSVQPRRRRSALSLVFFGSIPLFSSLGCVQIEHHALIIVFYLNTVKPFCEIFFEGGAIVFFFFNDFESETFAERLKKLRLSKGLTLEALANDVNATKSAIGNFEHSRKKPSLDALIALADFFDVSLDYLVGRSDHPETK